MISETIEKRMCPYPGCRNIYPKGVSVIKLEPNRGDCKKCKSENVRIGEMPCDHAVCMECVWQWNDKAFARAGGYRSPGPQSSTSASGVSASHWPSADIPAHSQPNFGSAGLEPISNKRSLSSAMVAFCNAKTDPAGDGRGFRSSPKRQKPLTQGAAVEVGPSNQEREMEQNREVHFDQGPMGSFGVPSSRASGVGMQRTPPATPPRAAGQRQEDVGASQVHRDLVTRFQKRQDRSEIERYQRDRQARGPR